METVDEKLSQGMRCLNASGKTCKKKAEPFLPLSLNPGDPYWLVNWPVAFWRHGR